VRYAVPEAVRTDGGSECFVVAYANRDCRYDRIAAPRIVEFGFGSREAAVARTNTCLSTTTEHKRVARALVVDRAQELQHGVRCPERRSGTNPTLRLTRHFLIALYRDAIAAAIFMFSSRNFISSAIRTFLAVSF
jgi:hypothetical protein